MKPNAPAQLKHFAVPRDRANWTTIQAFALGFDGYEWAGSFEKCGELANSTRTSFDSSPKHNLPKLSTDELRACLFFEQRRFRHFGEEPTGSDMKYIRVLLKALRESANAPSRKTLVLSRATAAAKYIPSHTRVLFIAEAPPNDLERYFYFENVKRDDWLWIGLMKALYQPEFSQTKQERKRKPQWLARFQRDGFRLIDAVKKPLSGTTALRIAAIRTAAPALISEIRDIAPEHIVLIKSTVHEGLFQLLQSHGLSVINETAVPFPATGQQQRFQIEFSRLIASGNVLPD